MKKLVKTPRKKKVVFSGQRLTLYSVGWLCVLVNRSSLTVRKWERDKILPKPIFSDSDGGRWYHSLELESYAQQFKKFNIRRGSAIKATDLKAHLLASRNAIVSILERDKTKIARRLSNEMEIIKFIKYPTIKTNNEKETNANESNNRDYEAEEVAHIEDNYHSAY